MTPPTTSFVCIFCGERHGLGLNHCPSTSKVIEPVHKMSGKVISGKYEVRRFVAEGGMGVVYEGHNRDIGRQVAIKFLPFGATMNPLIVRRFQNEARIAASVGSRNIVDVLDMGQTRTGIHYIVMEYLEGTDLADFLDEAIRLPYPWAVDVAIQVLEALKQVHARGVIHRDLKPANIRLVHEPDGSMTVKIVDFGISCLEESRKTSSATGPGPVFGTPRYMSPEQARGQRSIDQRSDLYSVGVMLYKMVSGSYPFESEDTGELINLVASAAPLHVSRHGIALPAGLEAVIMWAIGTRPEERFAEAEEFIEALQPYRDAASMDTLESVPPRNGGRGLVEQRPITLEEPVTTPPRRASDELPTIRPEEGWEPPDVVPPLPQDGSPVFRVRLPDVPEDATVLVDDTLHAERPVLVQGVPDEHGFTVQLPDGRVWERTVLVDGDLVFFIDW